MTYLSGLASRISDVLGFKLQTSFFYTKILSRGVYEIEGGELIQSEIVGSEKLSGLSRSRSKLMTLKSLSDLRQPSS